MSGTTAVSQEPPRHPWFKFFPSDWHGDERLAMCSLASRGLLAEFLCLMHRATPYGHLLINGEPPTDLELTRLVRAKSLAEFRRLRDELIARGALSRTDSGTIFSRRMVRKAQQSAIGHETGKRGGNPILKPNPLTETLNPPPIREPLRGGLKTHIPYAICQKKKEITHASRSLPDPLLGELFDRFWAAYPKKVSKPAAWKAWQRIDPRPDADFTAAVIAAVERQKAGWDNPKFIPHPGTWLNGRRWEDEVIAVGKPAGPADYELLQRARLFLAEYPKVYSKCRAGAIYRPREDRDLPTALDLVSVHQTDERLDALVEVFLKRTDCGNKNVPGTIGQFAHMAPDCDRLLREYNR